jgi:hypothetical protein
MNASRAAVMVVGVNLIAVWAAAAAGSLTGQPARPAAVQAPTPDEAVVQARSELVESTARLRRFSGPPPEGAAVARDPFRFGGRPRLAPPAEPPAESRPALMVSTAPDVPAEPEILLQGMAESREGEATVRTAILSADGELVFATVGATIAGRYTVLALHAESADLEDARSGARRTVRMK